MAAQPVVVAVDVDHHVRDIVLHDEHKLVSFSDNELVLLLTGLIIDQSSASVLTSVCPACGSHSCGCVGTFLPGPSIETSTTPYTPLSCPAAASELRRPPCY